MYPLNYSSQSEKQIVYVYYVFMSDLYLLISFFTKFQEGSKEVFVKYCWNSKRISARKTKEKNATLCRKRVGNYLEI